MFLVDLKLLKKLKPLKVIQYVLETTFLTLLEILDLEKQKKLFKTKIRILNGPILWSREPIKI